MSVVVGGGTGFIGRHFARLGLGKKYRIINVSRTAGPHSITWEDLERNGLPEDCKAVVSMSGEPILQPFKKWTPDFKKVLHESRVAKTRLLSSSVAHAVKSPKVFVTLSGVAYYKPDHQKEYTEEDFVAPYDFLSNLTKDWEHAAELCMSENPTTRSVIIRTGVVLGKDGGMIQNIKLPFYLGGGGPIGDGKQWFPWIHVEDIAGLIWHSIEKSTVKGVLNGVSPGGVTSGEFTKAYANAMCRPHLIPLPAFAVSLMFGQEAAAIMLEGQKVLPHRTLESGYNFVYPDIYDACQELVS